jgi:hypothetical protein
MIGIEIVKRVDVRGEGHVEVDVGRSSPYVIACGETTSIILVNPNHRTSIADINREWTK